MAAFQPSDSMNLKIPERIEEGLRKLASLSIEQMQELSTILETERPTLIASELARRVSSKTKTLREDSVDEIVDAIISLHAGADSTEMPVIDFAEAVYEAVDLELPEEQENHFRGFLEQVLGIKAIAITSKALNVLLEHEHTLHSARIMTDVRPIFVNWSIVEPPEGTLGAALIIHSLKLSYHEGQQINEIFVALDASDIDALRHQLDRAEGKAEELRAMLERANVDYIETN